MIDSKHIPEFNGETNSKKLLNALAYGDEDESLVLDYDNRFVLFIKVNK